MSIPRFGFSGEWTNLPSALVPTDSALINRGDVLYRVTGAQMLRNTVTVVTSSSGTATFDWSLGDYFTITLSEDVTTITISNTPGSGFGTTIAIEITQDSTARTVAWPASFRWEGGSAGAVSTGNGDVDLLILTTFDNGTTWDATLSNDRS